MDEFSLEKNMTPNSGDYEIIETCGHIFFAAYKAIELNKKDIQKYGFCEINFPDNPELKTYAVVKLIYK